MTVILDTSAALEIALNRPGAVELSPRLEQATAVVSPELMLAELANALWKEHVHGGLAIEACYQAMEVAEGLVGRWVSHTGFFREAFALSRALKLPAYDMFYLALAKREEGMLLTMDGKLRKVATLQGVRVS